VAFDSAHGLVGPCAPGGPVTVQRDARDRIPVIHQWMTPLHQLTGFHADRLLRPPDV